MSRWSYIGNRARLTRAALATAAARAQDAKAHDARVTMLVFMLVVLMWMRMYLAGGVNVAVRMDQTRLFQ